MIRYMIRFAIYLFVGYLVGAMLSDHIFLDLSLTHWSNLWVYFWLILWPVGLIAMFFLWSVIILAICLAVFGVYRLFAR